LEASPSRCVFDAYKKNTILKIYVVVVTKLRVMEPVSTNHNEEEDNSTDYVPEVVEPLNTTKATEQNEKNESVEAINYIYNNIHAAQSMKGAFTMEECVLVVAAKDKLLKFFETGNKSFASDDINEASLTFLRGGEKQQATGVFHMQGSIELYNRFKFIEKELGKRKNPADGFKELRQKKTLQNQPSRNNNNNNKRGGKNT
jgi:hypothetical protein